MNNQSLYQKFYEMRKNETEIYQYNFKTELSNFYGSLLPLEEIDTKLEKIIVDHYSIANSYHIKFLILNLKKTTTQFKNYMQFKLGYIFIRDLTEEQIISHMKDCFRKNLQNEKYDENLLYRPDLSFSEEGQDKLMDLHPLYIQLINNPSEKSILTATATRRIDIYQNLKKINYPMTEALFQKIKMANKDWYQSNKIWDKTSIPMLIQEYENPDNYKQLCYEYDEYRTNKPQIFFRENSRCLLTYLYTVVLCHPDLSSIDLYKLSQSQFGLKELNREIKEHPKYKTMAQLVLDGIKVA